MIATLLLGLAALAALVHPVGAAPSTDCTQKQWVSAWGASPSDGSFSASDVAGKTARIALTPTISGHRVRVVLTNRYSSGPITVTDAFIGVQGERASLEPGTNRRLTFNGRSWVTVEPGQEATSDPLEFELEAFQPVAISAAVAQSSTSNLTEDAAEPAYVAPGNLAAADDGAAFAQTRGRPLVATLQTKLNRRAATVAAFGDSITDGPLSGEFGYPEFLALRLAAAEPRQRLSVLNAGIGGNQLLKSGPLPLYAPRGLSRFDADVMAQAGVSDVIVLIGINDIGHRAEPPDVIAGLSDLVQRLRDAGIRPFLGTLTPSGGHGDPRYGGDDAFADRVAVNEWIRRQALAAVIDFDRALADPADPSRLRPAYDSGDHLHPNAAGYARMAHEVDVEAFQGRVCDGA